MVDRPGLKWNSYDPDVIGAWVAEMDFGLAPPITEALHSAIDRGDTGYLYPAAWNAVAESASVFWRDRLGWEVSPERVVHVPDVVDGAKRAIAHLTKPGSPVILHTPVYFPFFSLVEAAGRERIGVRSIRDDDGRWRLDLDGIDRAFADGAGSILLCNPWNPVGRCLSLDEVSDVIAIADRHGGRVIADEIHSVLTFPESKHVAAAGISPETVITVTAASKAWNIPGLKAAQVVLTNDRDLTAWNDYFSPDKWGVGTLGLLASAAGYRDGGPWLDDVLVRLDANRALLGRLIAEILPEALYRPNEGTYLAWVDLGAYGWESPFQYILDNARVAFSDGDTFGPGGEGHVRINFATDPEVIIEMMERVGAVI